jgi:hypothetical protein
VVITIHNNLFLVQKQVQGQQLSKTLVGQASLAGEPPAFQPYHISCMVPVLTALHENKGPVTTFFLNTSKDPSVKTTWVADACRHSLLTSKRFLFTAHLQLNYFF